jgi:hypothetical protein
MVSVSRSSSNGESPRKKSFDKQVDMIPALAREPNLIAAIERDIASVGLVGEEDAGLLVYLAYSSRKLDKPLSVIIKGPSGSGKDQVQRKPAELMPPEDVVEFMSASPQALYYGTPGSFKNKVLLGGERSHQDDDAQRDKTAAIRQMISKGSINKHTVKDGEGKEIHQEGPVSYSETTTLDSIFTEDANRCLQIYTDDSEEQTLRVRDAIAERCMVRPSEDSLREVRKRHHEFQKALKPAEVIIPFAAVVNRKMTSTALTTRRLLDQITSLIKVVTYLHQFSRGKNKDGDLEATLDDYAVARRLVLGPLHEATGNHDHAALKNLLRKLPSGGTFTAATARNAWEMECRKTVGRWLARLASAGAIRLEKKGVAPQPDLWKKTGIGVDEAALPSVDTVGMALKAADSV